MNNNKEIKTIIKSLWGGGYYFINFLINIKSKVISNLINYVRYNKISKIINNIRNKYNNKSFKYKSKIKSNNNIKNIFAFSLIELSIVLIIIGLLVAGITGGASLIESAKIKALGDEINSYKQAYFTFKALNGRAPGDLNGSGMIGYFSGQTYNSNSFPDPYNSNAKNGIPNEISAPFVDLYLAKIIDFEPKEADKAAFNKINNSKPSSKILQDGQYYFETGKENAEVNESIDGHYKKGIKTGNHITISSKPNKMLDPKYLQSYDLKYDDGIYNNGSVRSGCVNDFANYHDTILNNNKCDVSIISLDY